MNINLVLEAAKAAGIATPIVFLVLVAVLALFPEFTVVLSAPVVIAGFNALFGISIAMPIIQSLLRHVQAGGFGTIRECIHSIPLTNTTSC